MIRQQWVTTVHVEGTFVIKDRLRRASRWRRRVERQPTNAVIDRLGDQRCSRGSDSNESRRRFNGEVLRERPWASSGARRDDLCANGAFMWVSISPCHELQRDPVEYEHCVVRHPKLPMRLQDAELTLHLNEINETKPRPARGNLKTRTNRMRRFLDRITQPDVLWSLLVHLVGENPRHVRTFSVGHSVGPAEKEKLCRSSDHRRSGTHADRTAVRVGMSRSTLRGSEAQRSSSPASTCEPTKTVLKSSA